MRNSIWNTRIPTLLGLFMLIIGVVVTSYLTQTGVIFTTKASPTHTPENIRITNVTDSSFSISYTTTQKVAGIISYGKDKTLNQTAVDDRNQQTDSLTPRQVHHMTIKNLSAQTKYYFSVTSGPDTYLNNGQLFEVTTAKTLDTLPTNSAPATGKIITLEGNDVSEALVYITTDGGQTLSTVVEKGKYIIPLNTFRNTSFAQYLSLKEDTILKLLAVDGFSSSNATVYVKQVSPVPTITLSQDYDFTASISPVATSSAQIGFPSFSVTENATTDPKITSPKKNESFTDQKPVFRGTAQPNARVDIVIHSDEQISTNTTSDSRGNWTYRPDKPLSPGQHTVTITTRDQFGILKTITQSFVVYAAGSEVSQSASSSAAVATPTPVPTTSTTKTPSVIPTATIIPTNIPTPTTILQSDNSSTTKGGVVSGAQVSQTQTTKGGQTIEDPGMSSTWIGIIALVITGTGILLFLLSKQNASV